MIALARMKRLHAEDLGQDLVEYALVLAVVCLTLVAGIGSLSR